MQGQGTSTGDSESFKQVNAQNLVGFVTAQRAKAMAEAKHPKNWKELGHANPMRDIFVEKLVRPIHIA